ncbi:MAG: hypothetical protein IJ281_07515 [Clostridia bacterium]|nr:hypothetical protein [Clostridia bacterium]
MEDTCQKNKLKKLRIFTIFYRHWDDQWVPEDEKVEPKSKAWYEKEKQISRLIYQESSFITTHLECLLRPYKIFPCSRLNVFCVPSGGDYSEFIDEINLHNGIAEMHTELDMRYLSFTAEEKTEYLLNKIEEVLLKFCAYFSVDDAPVREECFKVRELLSKKSMLGPYQIQGYKTLRQNGIGAKLISYNSIKSYHFFVLLSSPVIGKVEIPFFETLPGGLNTIAPLGNFYWKDDQTLCIEDACKGNPYASPEELLPDKLLDVTEYRVLHNAGKKKK